MKRSIWFAFQIFLVFFSLPGWCEGQPLRLATASSPEVTVSITSHKEKIRNLKNEAFGPDQKGRPASYLVNTNRKSLRIVIYTSLRMLLLMQNGKPPAYYPVAVGKDNWLLDGNYSGELKKFISRFHTVQNGDTLWSISRRFKVDSFTLASFNELAVTDLLFPGKILRIPKANIRLTPHGVFTITNKLKDPVYRKDYQTLRPFNENTDNLFGTRWIGLNKSSYGIHGTNEPETIGTYSTDGCVRMLNGDIEELFDFVEPGFLVEITKKPNY